ncbi:MAG TPA: hypothetical protein PKC18_01325 [Lacipirellulaceae bacterium]|nr:hypothetical protein [Lacipirellulaceae bacterium]
MDDVADLAWLIGPEGAAWLRRVAADSRPTLQRLAALRRDLSTDRARLVVEQTELRDRAAEKFGDCAGQMYFTPVLLEQATDRWVAEYKASRFSAAGGRGVLDGCCGLGGDLRSLARRGGAVGVDRSPAACLLAGANAGAGAVVQCADVESIRPDAGQLWHMDPDRRASGRRTTQVVHYAPGLDVIDRWRQASPDGAVKLAPAAAAPAVWHDEAEREWTTRDRQCRQQVAWFGALATSPGRCRATLVRRDGYVATFAGASGLMPPAVETPARYLFDPDPSVLASGLLGAIAAQHGLASLGAGGAYLTGERPIVEPLLTPLAVIDCLPLRAEIVARYLAARAVGRVEIKKRGVSLDPATWQRRLKLRGEGAATLVLTRVGRRETAIVVERPSA